MANKAERKDASFVCSNECHRSRHVSWNECEIKASTARVGFSPTDGSFCVVNEPNASAQKALILSKSNRSMPFDVYMYKYKQNGK